jgi:hypothetical protein
MSNSKLFNISMKLLNHQDDEWRQLQNMLRKTGLTGLLLSFLLISIITPVSASDSNARLYATAPTPFLKLTPANGATNQPTSLTLDWATSQFVTLYYYCIDSNLTPGHVGICDNSWISTPNSYMDISGLSYSTVYEWQVYAENADGQTYANSGNWFQFTTSTGPPAAFSKTTPIDSASNQATSLTLTWASSSGATSYEYCYDSTIDSLCAGSWITNGSSTSAPITGLSLNTQYEWQVRAVNSNPTMTYANGGSWWTFTTSVASPGTFSKVFPASSATNQQINLSLSWDASTGATSYDYCYEVYDGDSTCDGSWTNTGLTYANLIGLNYGQQYEWQVVAKNSNPSPTEANSGTWWTFTTKANPGGFNKLYPSDSTTNIPINIFLEWTTYTGATSFEYCIDPTASGTLDVCDTGWHNVGMDISDEVNLSHGTEYEWQVMFNDSIPTYADSGAWFTFTTVTEPPGTFSKLLPLDGAINQPLNLTLTWEESSGATSYKYCFDYTLNTICDSSWITSYTNSVEIAGLGYNDTYEWQVRAYNDNPDYTRADSGVWHQFTIVVAQPGGFFKINPTNNELDQPINLTLSWSTSAGATSYEYCYDANIDQTCGTAGNGTWTSTGATTSASLIGLVNATQYEWQVRAKNANPNSTYADTNTWWTFTTVVSLPGSFGKISPAHASMDLIPSAVTLQWETSSSATGYYYCVDTNLNSYCDASWTSVGASTSVLLPGLTFNNTFEWQILAVNDNPTGTYANANTWWQFSTRVGTPPGSFSKQYPLDTVVDIPTNPTLQWTTSSNATRYEYCIDVKSVGTAGVCNTSWVNNGSSRQVTLSSLALNTTYEWQVRAWNDSIGPTYANSETIYWTFTTVVIDPPGAFGKTTPVNSATSVSPVSLTLNWETSTNASIYEYCYDDTVNNSCSTEWHSKVDTSVVLDLAYGKQYEWQVRAFRTGNPNPTYANAGSWWSFTTVVASPTGFNKSEPVNLAIDRPSALMLTWEISSGATSYEYCYEVYDGNSTCEGDSWLPAATNSADISGLSYATTYGWQVRALNANPTKTYANSGTWHQFTTLNEMPAAFSKSSPADMAINQPLTLVLSWSPSGGATSYAYCYDNSANDDCTGTWTATTATSAAISGLSYGTEYEWQVRAVNSTGTIYANDDSLWTFTTLPTPPGAFNKVNPVKKSTGQPLDVTLTWGTSSNATGYEYCIDTTLDSVCDGDAWISTGILTSTDPAGLTYLTTYQWQVRALNTNPNPTEADSGSWWLFTTMVSPPGPFDKISPANGTSNQPPSQYLTWQPSSGATSYSYCLDTNLNETCDTSWVPTTLLYAIEPALTYGATYEWQVKAHNNTGMTDANDGDTNEWWVFQVKAEPANSKANPNLDAVNQPVDLELKWTNVPGVIRYEYCIDVTLDATCDGDDWSSTGLNNFVLVEGLPNGTTIEWQTRTVINESPLTYVYANTGETPEWWTFTTVEAPPQNFSKSTPSHASTSLAANELTLSWETNLDASGYRYCLDTNLAVGHVGVCDTSWITVGSGTTSVVISNLEYSATYEWQVMASNNNPIMTGANMGETPEWWTFTTTNAPPEAFNKINPVNIALNQPIALSLSWQATVGAVEYQYCIDTSLDNACDGDAWVSTGVATSAAVTSLLYDTQYEWQVRAYSNNPFEPALSDGGIWHEFRTVVEAPGVFTKSIPADGATRLSTSLMISWNSSARATGYQYCLDSNLVNPGCDSVWISTISTHVYIFGLSNNTEYEWHVRAINANPVITESDDGDWFTFSTIPLFNYLPAIIKAPLAAPILNPVTVGPGMDTYTLSWNSISGATSYKIWESTSLTFPVDPTYEGITTTNFTLPAGVNPTRYYYYVKAATASSIGGKSNVVSVDRQYELEDNSSSATANGQIFNAVTYYGRPNDLKDFYKIYLDAPATITVTMPSYPPSWIHGQMQLLDGSTLQAMAWDVNPSNGMSLTYENAPSGWYYIYIATPVDSRSSEWYSFIVTITE